MQVREGEAMTIASAPIDQTPEEADVADLLVNPRRRKELHGMWKQWNESEAGKRERERYLQSKERKL